MMTVQHQPGQSRFVVACEGGPAVLEYTCSGPVIDFHRTWVPQAQRGSGIALALVKAGLAWAAGQGMDVQASCWYVQQVLDRQA